MTRRWSHSRSQAQEASTAGSPVTALRVTHPVRARAVGAVWLSGVVAAGLLLPTHGLLGQSGGPRGAALNAVQNAENSSAGRENRAAAVADDADAALEQSTQPVPGGQSGSPEPARSTPARGYNSLKFTVSDGGGSSAPVGNRPDVYQIQNGDTLWMLSGQFWGDPYFWPTLWSYNPYISNAHLIYPGNNLRFTPGSYVRPPGMAIDDGRANPGSGETIETAGGGTSVANASDGICRPSVPFVEQVGSLTVHPSGFLREQGFAPLGKIVKAPDSKSLLTERDLVYVQFNRMSDVQCGDIYTIYHPLLKKVAHPIFKGRNVGSLYRTLGELEIVDVNDFAATARVRKALEEIGRGDLVTEKLQIEKTVTIRRSAKEVDGYIVESMNYEQSVLGINDVIYIDRGEQDNVAAGDTFYIVRQGDGIEGAWRNGAKDITMPYQIVGRIVVLEPGEYVSQAVITEASGVIEVGDHITTQVD